MHVQAGEFTWDEPLLRVHSAWQQAEVFDAMRRVEQMPQLLAEIAQYVHSYAGASINTDAMLRMLVPTMRDVFERALVLCACHPLVPCKIRRRL